MLGSWLSGIYWRRGGTRSRLVALYLLLFGIPELHSHIRYQACRNFVTNSQTTVDIGAGGGSMTVAFASQCAGGFVAVENSREQARRLRDSIQMSRFRGQVSVVAADASTGFLRPESTDQVLLIDVLEHVYGEDLALTAMSNALRPGGRLLVSVPTKRYVGVFGADFDRAVGHLRHYSLPELQHSLELHGFRMIAWRYHTHRLGAWLCEVWYQGVLPGSALWEHRASNFVLMSVFPLFLVLSLLDSLLPVGAGVAKSAAGLVVLAEKVSCVSTIGNPQSCE